MKFIWNFLVWSNKVPARPQSVQLEEKPYARVRELLSKKKPPAWPRPDLGVEIEEPESSKILVDILDIITSETGKRPFWDAYPTAHQWASLENFHVRRNREYDEKDLLGYELFRWTIKSGPMLANFKAQEAERLIATKPASAKFDIGRLLPDTEPLVSERLKLILESSEIVGLQFHPVRMLDARSVTRTLWQPWSDIRMPEVQLQKITASGKPFEGDYIGGLVFKDDALPSELRFKRKEVEQMSPFDFALTQECTGVTTALCFRNYIVTPKFREVIKELTKIQKSKGLKMAKTEFIPVHLV